MKEILEPLALIPGVKIASLISEDGVPIASTHGAHSDQGERTPIDRDTELNGFTALASGWFADLTRAANNLTWAPPRRVVLRATKGEIVLLRASTAVVLVLLERGVTAEEVRIPMEGALARMQRLLRELESVRGPMPATSMPSVSQPQGELTSPGILSESAGHGTESLAHERSDSSGDA